MSEWEFSDFASKDNLLRTVREQSDQMLPLASAPGAWEAPTASGHWQVRDIIGHLVDTTEGYFEGSTSPVRRHRSRPARRARHGQARRRGRARVPRHAAGRAAGAPREGPRRDARVHRGPRRRAVGRLPVPHKYMGPLPAFFYPVAQLVDYAVHTWDIRQGAGGSHALDGDAADLLVPFCWIVWQSTADCADVEPFQIGVRSAATTGRHAVSVSRRRRPRARDLADAGVATRRLMALIERRLGERRWPRSTAPTSERAALRSERAADHQSSRSDARSAPARRAAELLPHQARRHVADAGGRVEPAVGAGDDAARVADRPRGPLDAVGDHLGVLDVVARRVDHPGDERHVVGQRALARSSAPRGRGGRSPSRSPARRRSRRRAAAGCRSNGTSWVCGPS